MADRGKEKACGRVDVLCFCGTQMKLGIGNRVVYRT